MDEHKPRSFDELSSLKRIVDDDWRMLQLQETQTAVFNAAIGAQMLDELAERAGADPTQQAGLAITLDAGEAEQVRMKMLVFAALAGDKGAVESVEQRLGRGIGISPQITTRLSECMPMLNYLDRAIKESMARRDAARRQLVQARAERLQRIQSRRPTVADIRASLSLASYIELRDEMFKEQQMNPLLSKAEPARDPVDEVSVHAPRDDVARSIRQPGTPDDVAR